MALELPDGRELSDEALQVLRLRALRGIELGYSELDLADLLGVCNETISRWWTAYVAAGLPALPGGRRGRPLGSGRFLSDQQAERIKARIDLHSPEEVGIPHALWTRRAVRDLIRKELGIDLAERTVGLYLRRWGYTSKRSARRPTTIPVTATPAKGSAPRWRCPGPTSGSIRFRPSATRGRSGS